MKFTRRIKLPRPWRSVAIALALIIFGVYSHQIAARSAAAEETIQVILLALLVHCIERDFLWKELSKSLSGVVEKASQKVSNENNALIGAAADGGLTRIYLNREAAQSDVDDTITNANSRVWLLAVAISEKVNLEQFAEDLKKRLESSTNEKQKFDLKILVADPLRSPAVFRSFLESTAKQNEAVYEYPRPSDENPLLDPFCGQTLFKKVHRVFQLLDGPEYEIMRDAVRFYAHDPSCWLVIADQTAFFEPYTFGKPENVKAGCCIGGYFPVFKFERGGPEAKSFQILEDHFNKLWITTDTDWFHFRAKLSELTSVIDSVFKRRGDDWFRRVWQTLAKDDAAGKYERRSPRRRCTSDGPIAIDVCWSENGSAQKVTANRIRDYSRTGISLTFEKPVKIPAAQIVNLALDQAALQKSVGQVRSVLDYFLKGDLKVVLPHDGNQQVIGLERIAS